MPETDTAHLETSPQPDRTSKEYLFPFLETYFKLIPPEKHREITDAITTWAGGHEHIQQYADLTEQFNHTDPNDIIEQKQIYPEEIGQIFALDTLLTVETGIGYELTTQFYLDDAKAYSFSRNEQADYTTLLPLINALAQHTPPALWYPLSVLLSGVHHDDLSPEAKAKLNCEESPLKAELVPHQWGWSLCTDAERKFFQAINKHRWVHSGPLFIKGMGRLVALPTKNFVTSDGAVFLAGVYYSPLEKRTRSYLRGALGSLTTQCDPPFSHWTPLRVSDSFSYPLRGTPAEPQHLFTPEELLHALQEAINTAGSLHDTNRDEISPQLQQSTYEEPMIAGDLQ